MNPQFISCPKCGQKIELTDAIAQQILKAKEQELDQKLIVERDRLEAAAKLQAEQNVAVELQDLKNQLADRSRQLDGARQHELELRRRQRELEEREQNQELELTRKLDAERQKIRQEAATKSLEEHQLKLREKDLLLDQMRRQIDELQRKAELGPQQRQGEVLELELEEVLRSKFPADVIEPVAKGRRGGDVLQRVRSANGQTAGTIVWEFKRAKAWSEGWIEKLRDDQRDAKAEVAVLVSDVLPAEVNCISQAGGVWIVDCRSALGLALALREVLLQVHRTRGAALASSETLESLRDYISGSRFKQRVEALVESFVSMKADLDAERRTLEKHWSRRQVQLERSVRHMAGLYGDLEGILGKSLPAVSTLELPAAVVTER